MQSKEWIGVIGTCVTLMGAAGGIGVWAADQRYVTHDAVKSLEANRLDREITYLEIKIQQNEATNSEKIYIETLKQQLRALEQN